MSSERPDSSPTEQLLAAVQASAKYRDVCPDLIRRLGAHELQIRRNLKEAVKETKNSLHQVGGAYLDGKMRYAGWLADLEAALQAGEPQHFRRVCVEIMEHHASTRERLPVLEPFYASLLSEIHREKPIGSVLDIACGLNPLALAWMPITSDATYYACDIFGDMIAFLNHFFVLTGVAGEARVCDVITNPPLQKVDVALILKALPVFEQSDRAAGLRLLRALQADHMVVSFPTRSLGGRGKGMAENYAARFQALIAEEKWDVRPTEFANELCFVIRK